MPKSEKDAKKSIQIVDPDDMKLDNDNGLDGAISKRLAHTTKHNAKLVTPNEPMIMKTSI